MNHVCKKCQAVIEENAKFCSHCGCEQELPVTDTFAKNPEVDDGKSISVVSEIPEIQREYQFQKKKYIGQIKYTTTTTRVQLETDYMVIVQEKKTLGFFKTKLLDIKVEYGDIHDIVTKKTMDTYDLFFAIICCVLGVFVPLTFLLALVLLWVGYGKKVHIFTTKNVYKIPSLPDLELNKLLIAIKTINPNIFVKG